MKFPSKLRTPFAIFVAIAVIWLTITLALQISEARKIYFVGSTASEAHKVHVPTCMWAQKINEKNLIKFRSLRDAKRKGFEPCGVCNPGAQ